MRQTHLATITALVLAYVGATACSDVSGLAGKEGFPAGTGDPSSFSTPEGALGLYNATLAAFQYVGADTLTELGSSQSMTSLGAFPDYLINSGVLTDEIQSGTLNLIHAGPPRYDGPTKWDYVNARQLQEGIFNQSTDGVYNELQGIRGGANMAIGALTNYAPEASPALAGHMHALIGYAEIFLADMFCSGVPLSTLDFHGDFTYRAGSQTADIYRDAIAHFDLAIAASGDSARILNLAKVGKGRALLALGHTDSAALAVTGVPDNFAYQFPVDWTPMFSAANNRFFSSNLTFSDSEGVNGLPYLTNGETDPRTASGIWATTQRYHVHLYVPFKFSTDFSSGDPAVTRIGTVSQVTVADGIEARLIRAEAALAAGNVGGWLDQLNTLRHTATTVDLGDLADPGDQTARVALLFKERAYWLYATGHRQGDLRRMIRQYHFAARDIYPTDVYPPGTTISRYGDDVTAPVPQEEHNNPLFTGCLSRGA